MAEIPQLEHSRRYPPSGMERVSKCTASAIHVNAFGELPPEQVTIDGVLAHHVLETCLKTGADAWEFVGHEFTQGDYSATFTSDHAEEIGDVIAHIRGLMKEALKPEEDIVIEARLDFPDHPEMFGTTDFAMVRGDSVVVVIDLKFGFIVIEPDAFQLRIYLLMMILNEFEASHLWEGPLDEVIGITGVAQPRAFGLGLVRTEDITRKRLQETHVEVMSTIAKVERGEVVWNAGPHCRYCPIGPICPRLKQIAEDAAAAELIHDPALKMTGADIDNAMQMLPALKIYAKRIEGLAMQYLEGGGNLNNTKLVWKQAQRKWRDPAQVKKFAARYKVDPMTEPTLRSPAQLEKVLPKTARPKIKNYTTKLSSGLTVAAPNDPRKQVNRSVSDKAKAQAKIASQRLKASGLTGH